MVRRPPGGNNIVLIFVDSIDNVLVALAAAVTICWAMSSSTAFPSIEHSGSFSPSYRRWEAISH
jgi:hypothetical protein